MSKFYQSQTCKCRRHCYGCRNSFGSQPRKHWLTIYTDLGREDFDCPLNLPWHDGEMPPEQFATFRDTAAAAHTGGYFDCPKFEIRLFGKMEEICARCHSDASYRTWLFNQYLRKHHSKALSQDCLHRGEQVGEVECTVCGGRIKMVPLYRCEKLKKDVLKTQCFQCRSHSRLSEVAVTSFAACGQQNFFEEYLQHG